jgi:ribonuclease HII
LILRFIVHCSSFIIHMPTFDEECQLQRQGYWRIAGIDEAGRGCWAGPVVAAAIVLPPMCFQYPELLAGVDDSKRLSSLQRAQLEARIRGYADGIGVAAVPAHIIDSLGIVEATRLAMQSAVLSLSQLPDALLIDALPLPGCVLPQRAIIRGDGTSLSIAAASIIAKMTRDRLMAQFDRAYPAFRFGLHKGYGTALHMQVLRREGATSVHRRSFKPIWNLLQAEENDAS